MADKNSGWSVVQGVEILSNTNDQVLIRVAAYWKNNGWTYDLGNHISAWVYCGVECVQVANNVSLNASNNQGQYLLGYHDFVYDKATYAQNITTYAKITSNSSYVSGTKISSDAVYTIQPRTSYTISYNANGGTGAPGNQTKWYNMNTTLSSNVPTRGGYTFQGWATSSTGSVAYNPGATYTANANVDLFAVWKVNATYTISYNANGGTGAPGDQTKTHDVNIALSSVIPTRTGYAFKGWNSNSSGTGASYSPGATYTANAHLDLFAVWEWIYTKPRINNFKVQRCTSNGTVSETGTYIKATFDWVTDYDLYQIFIDWGFDRTWATYENIQVTGQSGKSGSVNCILGNGTIDIEKTYLVRGYVNDGTGATHTPTLIVGTTKFPIDVKKGGTGVAIGKTAEKDAFDIAMDIYDKFGTKIGNGLSDYGNIDANTTMSSLCLSELNTPNNSFYYVMTMFYATKNETSSRTQLAVPYIYDKSQSKNNLYLRQYVNGEWKDWYSPTKGDILYDNASGTTGTVTLSKSVAEYVSIKIYFHSTSYGFRDAVEILHPNGAHAALNAKHVFSNSNTVVTDSRRIAISGTSITGVSGDEEDYGYHATHSNFITKTNRIVITRVVGYK